MSRGFLYERHFKSLILDDVCDLRTWCRCLRSKFFNHLSSIIARERVLCMTVKRELYLKVQMQHLLRFIQGKIIDYIQYLFFYQLCVISLSLRWLDFSICFSTPKLAIISCIYSVRWLSILSAIHSVIRLRLKLLSLGPPALGSSCQT